MSEEAVRERMREYVANKPVRKRVKKEWIAPVITDFAEGSVLAFDQTFSKTGWCAFTVYGECFHLIEKGVIKEPPTGLKGFDDTLTRAMWMIDRIVGVVTAYKDRQRTCVPQPPVIVHEMPAVHGYRPESSLLGALGVWQAASAVNISLFMVANQHMRAVLCGPGSDPGSKRSITTALNRYLDTSKGWNADERDALALGLTHLWDRKNKL